MKRSLVALVVLTGCSTSIVDSKVDKSPRSVYLEVAKAVEAAAPTPISACGDVWGDVVLTQDISSTGDCLTPKASGITIDGAGHTISSPTKAVNVMMKHHVTVKNIKTTAGIQIYGGDGEISDYFSLLDSQVGFVGFYSAGHADIERNSMTGLQFGYISKTAKTVGNKLIKNKIEGDGFRMIDFGGNWGDSTHPCPATNDLIQGNRIMNHETRTTDEPMALYYRCGTNFTIKGNTISADGEAGPLVLRDGANKGLIEGNVFYANGNGLCIRGAIQMISGNEGVDDKGKPSDLMIRDNWLISSCGWGVWMQARGDRNQFINNRVYGYDKGCFFMTKGNDEVFRGNVLNCTNPISWADGVGPGLVWDQP